MSSRAARLVVSPVSAHRKTRFFERAPTGQVLGFSTYELLVFSLAERECKFSHAPSEAVEMD